MNGNGVLWPGRAVPFRGGGGCAQRQARRWDGACRWLLLNGVRGARDRVELLDITHRKTRGGGGAGDGKSGLMGSQSHNGR